MKKKPRYETEAALCADFISWTKRQSGKIMRAGMVTPNWIPYAETAGWDILLVGDDGTQIGIQAKLKFNMKVLMQSVPSNWGDWRERGPDYRAVLVPERDSGQGDLCAALGLMMMTPHYDYGNGMEFEPGLDMHSYNAGWHYWSPHQRVELPEFVPDVIAGDSAPVQLTKWKIAALRIVATLECRGYVTRQDFRSYSVDSRRWTGPGGWLIHGAVPGQFIRGPGLDFDAQHPGVYAQVLAEVRGKLANEIAEPA